MDPTPRGGIPVLARDVQRSPPCHKKNKKSHQKPKLLLPPIARHLDPTSLVLDLYCPLALPGYCPPLQFTVNRVYGLQWPKTFTFYGSGMPLVL